MLSTGAEMASQAPVFRRTSRRQSFRLAATCPNESRSPDLPDCRRADGLDEEISGAEAEALDGRRVGATTPQQDSGNVFQVTVPAQCPMCLQQGLVRRSQVDEREGGAPFARLRRRVGSAGREGYAVAVHFQLEPIQVGKISVAADVDRLHQLFRVFSDLRPG